VDRGDVDHPAPASPVHPGQDRPGEPERRLQHDRDHRLKPFRRELLDGGDVLEAGVVDQHVGGQVQAVQGGRAGQVGDQGGPADLARDPLGALPVDVEHGHLGAGAGQPARARLADAAGRAGDQGRPAVEVHAHPVPIPTGDRFTPA
jgi:hypothetical protein